jgi:hypothetical protein
MRFTRLLARLERQLKASVNDQAPTCIAYIPHKGRGEHPPDGKTFRSGPGLVVIYDPACPPKVVSDSWSKAQAP